MPMDGSRLVSAGISQNWVRSIFQLAAYICAQRYFYRLACPPQISSGRERPTGLPAKFGRASIPPSIRHSIETARRPPIPILRCLFPPTCNIEYNTSKTQTNFLKHDQIEAQLSTHDIEQTQYILERSSR